MYKLSMYYAMIKEKHRTKGPMPVKDILKEVKKEKAYAQCCKEHGCVWNRNR
jgi:hypothetical protein